jgi:hypothetical protein
LFLELKDILKFVTGGEVLPHGGIMVDVSEDNSSIYASTCMCELVIPKAMASWEYDNFRIGLLAAVNGNTFNCV